MTFIRNHPSMLGVAGILFVTMIWGSAFAFMKTSLTMISPLWFLAIRFIVATLALAAAFAPRLRKLNISTLRTGLLLSLPLAASYIAQAYGLLYTTAGASAFITATYVVFVPLLGWFVTKRTRPSQVIVGFITLLALAVFSLDSSLRISLGDVYTLICAVLCAVHIFLTGLFTRDHDAILLTLTEIAASTVIFLVAALIAEPWPARECFTTQVWGTILYTAVASTALALTIQTAAQRVLTATTAAVLFTGEALFGAFFGWWLLDELMNTRQLFGAAALLACMVASVMLDKK